MTQETVQVTSSVTVVIEQKMLYQYKVFINGIEQENALDYAAYEDKEVGLFLALESILDYYRMNKVKITNSEISAILLIFKSLNRKPLIPLEFQLLRT